MGQYYEDFEPGQVFTSPARTVTETDVVLFAGISGDYNPLHTDAESAKTGPFGQRVVHGPLGFSLLMGLLQRLAGSNLDGTAVAMLGIDGWRFRAPLFIDDTVHAVVTIEEMRQTSKADRGILFRRCQLVKQTGEVTQEGMIPVMVLRRPAAGAEPERKGEAR
jgi:acyl dehydratase